MLLTKSPDPGGNYRSIKGNRYQQDAWYLASVIRNAYPKLQEKLDFAQFEIETGRLLHTCEAIRSDADFSIEIQRFMAKLKDGHSRVSTLRFYEKGDPFFSLRLFREKGRFLIANIDKAVDSSAIGKPILAVNHIPIAALQDRILLFESAENDYHALHRFLEKAMYPRYWKAIGVIQHLSDSLTLTIQNGPDSEADLRLASGLQYQFYRQHNRPPTYPFTKQQNNGFFFKILDRERIAYLQMNTSLDYVAVKSEISNYTNFITRPLALGLMKKRTRNARNFGLVLQRFFAEIQEKNIPTVVLDLRNNSGGDERLGKQFIWYLTERRDINGFQDYYRFSAYLQQQVKTDYKRFARLYRQKYGLPLPADTLLNVTQSIFDAPPYFQDIENSGGRFLLAPHIPKFKGNVYVLTGPKTFSAAQVLATTIRDNNLGTIVGTPSGNKPSTQTGASLFKLPKTKLIVSLSYLYMERPDRSKNAENALVPDILVEKTLRGMQRGSDEPFEWIVGRHYEPNE